MRKNILILLVLALLASSLYAGFSGEVNAGAYYDIDKVEYGFLDKNAVGFFTIDLYGNTIVRKGRGSVYAEAKAMLGLSTSNGSGTSFSAQKGASFSVSNMKVNIRLDYARFIGNGWELGLLAVPGVANYASSSIDTYIVGDVTNYADMERAYIEAPGMYFKYKDNTFGFGVQGAKKNFNLTLYYETPKFTFGNNIIRSAFYLTKGQTSSWSGGASLKYGFASENVYAALGSDLAMDSQDDKAKFNGEIAASFGYKFIALNAYYATRSRNSASGAVSNLLSAKILSDFDSLGCPLRISFSIKDILARQDMSLMFGYRVNDNLLVKVIGGYVISSNGRNGEDIQYFNDVIKRKSAWSCSLGMNYNNDYVDVFADATLSAYLNDVVVVGVSSGISSSSIVSGAKLSLNWNADDLLKNSTDTLTHGHLGKVEASCSIVF